jgi:uncharacterized protein
VIFLDTGFLFALVSAKDEHHHRVRKILADFRDKHLPDLLLTTNHVIAETITLARKLGHGPATHLGERLYGETLARIYWTTPDEERAAFEYFKRYRDQVYSFTDCLSFVVMEKLGISEALAVDSDFTHRFVAIPGPIRGAR